MHSAILRQVRQPAVVPRVLSVDAPALAGLPAVVNPNHGPAIVEPNSNVRAWPRTDSTFNDLASCVLDTPMLVAFGCSVEATGNAAFVANDSSPPTFVTNSAHAPLMPIAAEASPASGVARAKRVDVNNKRPRCESKGHR